MRRPGISSPRRGRPTAARRQPKRRRERVLCADSYSCRRKSCTKHPLSTCLRQSRYPPSGRQELQLANRSWVSQSSLRGEKIRKEASSFGALSRCKGRSRSKSPFSTPSQEHRRFEEGQGSARGVEPSV